MADGEWILAAVPTAQWLPCILNIELFLEFHTEIFPFDDVHIFCITTVLSISVKDKYNLIKHIFTILFYNLLSLSLPYNY
jgi:hypothetical protein